MTVLDATGERFDRLPKWAQMEFERLQANLEHTQKRLDSALEAQGLGEDGFALTPKEFRTVRFPLGDGYIEVRQGVDRHGTPILEVHGSDSLLIRPRVSNGFTMLLDER